MLVEGTGSKLSRWSLKTAEKLVGPRNAEGPLNIEDDTEVCLQEPDPLKTGRESVLGPDGQECWLTPDVCSGDFSKVTVPSIPSS